MLAVELPPISAALIAYIAHHSTDGRWGSMMKDVAADKAKKTGQSADDATRRASERTALDRCYGQIGISAVAAAARYQGAAKNPAYAPVAINWYDRSEGAA